MDHGPVFIGPPKITTAETVGPYLKYRNIINSTLHPVSLQTPTIASLAMQLVRNQQIAQRGAEIEIGPDELVEHNQLHQIILSEEHH